MKTNLILAVLLLFSAFSASAQSSDSPEGKKTLVEIIKTAIASDQLILAGFPSGQDELEFTKSLSELDVLSVEKIQAIDKDGKGQESEVQFLSLENRTIGRSAETVIYHVTARKNCVVRLERLSDARICGMMNYFGSTISYNVFASRTLIGKLLVRLVGPIGSQG